jgi:hypothetical protein
MPTATPATISIQPPNRSSTPSSTPRQRQRSQTPADGIEAPTARRTPRIEAGESDSTQLLLICYKNRLDFKIKGDGILAWWRRVAAEHQLWRNATPPASEQTVRKHVEGVVAKRRAQQDAGLVTGGEEHESNWILALDAWVDVVRAAEAEEERKTEAKNELAKTAAQVQAFQRNLTKRRGKKKRPLDEQDASSSSSSDSEPEQIPEIRRQLGSPHLPAERPPNSRR